MTTVLIADIKSGRRHRSDLGDIASLAASIADVGLLQMPVVTEDLTLVAGERRLAALRSLGRTEVSVQIAYNLNEATVLLRAERDENTCRKAFAPTEEHAVYEALLALEKPKADERKAHGQTAPGRNASGNFPEALRSREAAAEGATGKPGRYKSLDKVGEVKALAADETQPEPVREVAKQALAEMDSTGRVDGSHKRVKDAQQAVAQQANPAVAAHAEAGQGVQNAKYVHAFLSALTKADDFLAFDAARLAAVLDESEADAVARYAASVGRFADQIKRGRSGLRLISGGN